MFDTPWIAALAALFLWWFATGILLWRVHAADRGGPDSHVWSVILSLPLFAGGVLGVNATLADPSPQGAWFAFLSALAIWGWVELAFLSGIITGPNTRLCPPGLAARARFIAAFRTVAWHETVLVVALVSLAYAAWGAANPFRALDLRAFVLRAGFCQAEPIFGGAVYQHGVLALAARASGQLLSAWPGQRVLPGLCHASGACSGLFSGTAMARASGGRHGRHHRLHAVVDAGRTRAAGTLVHGLARARRQTLALDASGPGK